MEERKELCQQTSTPTQRHPAFGPQRCTRRRGCIPSRPMTLPSLFAYATPSLVMGVCTGGCGGLECLDEWPVLSETQAQRKRKGSTWRVEYRTVVKTPQAP